MKKGLVPPAPHPGRPPARRPAPGENPSPRTMQARMSFAWEQLDSLSQTLAYLKIQVIRLRAEMRDCPGAGRLKPVLEDLREGLDAGCLLVRELRPVFRPDPADHEDGPA